MLFKNSLKAKSLVFLAMGAAACGQPASVTRPDAVQGDNGALVKSSDPSAGNKDGTKPADTVPLIGNVSPSSPLETSGADSSTSTETSSSTSTTTTVSTTASKPSAEPASGGAHPSSPSSTAAATPTPASNGSDGGSPSSTPSSSPAALAASKPGSSTGSGDSVSQSKTTSSEIASSSGASNGSNAGPGSNTLAAHEESGRDGRATVVNNYNDYSVHDHSVHVASKSSDGDGAQALDGGRLAADSSGFRYRMDCSLEDKSPVAEAKALFPYEYQESELPYVSTKRHPILTQSLGSYSGRVGSHFYIEDRQIVFKFNLKLPPRDAVHHVSDAYLEFKLNKLSRDGHPKTEFLCFLDEKVCSGRFYEKSEKTWQANINKKGFWQYVPASMNDYFVSQINADIVGYVGKKTLWGSEKFQIRIADLIGDRSEKAVADFLYGKNPTDQRLERTFRMAVADDTYIETGSFKVELQENTCLTRELDRRAGIESQTRLN